MSEPFSTRFVHPAPGPLGRLWTALGQCRPCAGLRRAPLSRFPFLGLSSQVRNVVYLNWLVDVPDAARFVPPGVGLWQRNGLTLLTILTYAHEHFGPTAAGPLRRMFPSPLQSNWRLYAGTVNGRPLRGGTVLFLRNILSSTAYALGARLLTDVLPAHVAHSFRHTCDQNVYTTEIRGRIGSAPALHCEARCLPEAALPPAFNRLFTSWEEAVRFLYSQEFSLAPVRGTNLLGESGIRIPIDIATILPAELDLSTFDCPMLAPIVTGKPTLTFVVPHAHFQVISERLLPCPTR